VVSLNFKLLIVLALGLFAYYAVTQRGGPAIDLTREDYSIGDRVSPGWQQFCLLGQQEIPQSFVRGISATPCDLQMGWELEVQEGRVLMVYFYENKQCEFLWFSGYFMGEDLYETWCLEQAETEHLSFQYENKIISLRRN